MKNAIARHRLGTYLMLVLACAGIAAHAQDFPTKPVRIFTPFPVGSGPEGVLRLLADKLSRTWGKPVAVATDSKYKTVADVIADAKANPSKLNHGSWPVGNPVHLGSALFEPFTLSRDQLNAYVQAESTRYGRIVKKMQISLD